MPQLTDKVIAINVSGHLFDELAENIFYVETDATVTSAMLEEVAGITANWVASDQLPLLNSGYIADRVVCTDQTASPGLQFINIDNQGNPGGLSGSAALPQNCTFAVHRNTGLSGKGAKSRIYWPGLQQNQTTAPGEVSATTANAFVDACESLRTALEAGTEAGYTYGYISRVLNGVERTNGLFVPVIGHSYTDLHMDSQRRRLPGRGA